MTMVSESPADRAKRANAELAAKIGRWKWVRLTAALGLAVAATAIAFTAVRYAAVPLFLLSVGVLFFYLEARDHQREVSSRQWKTVVPRVRSVISADPNVQQAPHHDAG